MKRRIPALVAVGGLACVLGLTGCKSGGNRGATAAAQAAAPPSTEYATQTPAGWSGARGYPPPTSSGAYGSPPAAPVGYGPPATTVAYGSPPPTSNAPAVAASFDGHPPSPVGVYGSSSGADAESCPNCAKGAKAAGKTGICASCASGNCGM